MKMKIVHVYWRSFHSSTGAGFVTACGEQHESMYDDDCLANCLACFISFKPEDHSVEGSDLVFEWDTTLSSQ